MDKKMGLLIILSGPSGVGKGTIREELFKDQNLNLVYSISMTTRKPRSNELNEKDYFFVNENVFQEKIANNELLEYAKFVDNYYGTPEKYVDKLLSQGKNVVLEIEVQGALQVLAKRPDAISFFVLPPSFEELTRRIIARRSEPEDIVQKRLLKAKGEMNITSKYKYVIVNDNLQQTVSEIKTIIMNEINANKN
ncbi:MULTISPECIES: guanylate kinase [unclassified Spiroplasma]|uniref:guanylate kinase n=1 Tax=unclassified Spiroplasma TaxID=2637901 RepID=UPI001C04BED9|nr:guanylate kinase [Spiroplasma endosymbiont of 'Nebria riversi']